MSTDHQPASYDPRYEGIYQRGGAGDTQRLEVQTPRHVPQQAPTRSPHEADTDDWSTKSRPPAAFIAAAPSGPASHSPSERGVDGYGAGAQDPSAIREVGSRPEASEVPGRARNPFDVWIWVAAVVLTGIGIYLTAAPALFERAMMEAQASGVSSSMTGVPWYHYTGMAAPPLIFLGVGTAVVQLFILSIRHTLRTR